MMPFSVKFKRAGSERVYDVEVGSNSLIKTQDDADNHIRRIYPSAEIIPANIAIPLETKPQETEEVPSKPAPDLAPATA